MGQRSSTQKGNVAPTVSNSKPELLEHKMQIDNEETKSIQHGTKTDCEDSEDNQDNNNPLSARLKMSCDDSAKKGPITLPLKRPLDESISLNISVKKSKASNYDDDEIHKKKKRKIEECDKDLGAKEEKLEALLKITAECKEEFVAMQKLIDGQTKDLKSEIMSIRSNQNAQMKDFESMKKQFEGQVKEFESREKQLQGRMKLQESKEDEFKGQVKEFELKRKQLEKNLHELELKEKQYEAAIKSERESVAASTNNQLSPTIDGSFQLLPSRQTNEVLLNLQASSDPAKLVLDIIRDPILPREENAIMIEEKEIFLLEQLMRVSPHIKPNTRVAAMNLALDLKARATTENSLLVLGFLQLLSIFGLASSFDEDEILKLFEFVAQHQQAVELFGILGFGDKVSDFVKNLIAKQQHIEAVRFICAYKLTDMNQPIDLLREYVQNAKNKSIKIQDKAIDQEIASLGIVLQCISDNNLDSVDLLNEIQDGILKLQRQKRQIGNDGNEN